MSYDSMTNLIPRILLLTNTFNKTSSPNKKVPIESCIHHHVIKTTFKPRTITTQWNPTN